MLEHWWSDLADRIETFADVEGPPEDWEGWLRELFPASVSYPFGDHHREFWEWVWSIPSSSPSSSSAPLDSNVDMGRVRPRPFIAVWGRGAAKSTSGELGIVALGARECRKYTIVVCSTQDQADKRVGEIASKMESKSIEQYYPALGQRAVGKFGAAKGWRRNRLHAASGFIVDALGLDTASRGLKAEDRRPDLIVIDDVDERHDTVLMTQRKEDTIKDTILPLGTMDAAVLCLQNLIIPHGVFSRLVRGEADYLVDRIVSGPIPAIRGLEIESHKRSDGTLKTVITGGEATWKGQSLIACQQAIDTFGISTFLREYQHEVDEVLDAMWTQALIDKFRVAEAPQDIETSAVGVDPQGSKKEGSETGIIVAERGSDGHGYITLDASINGTPHEWGTASVGAYDKRHADFIVGERNYGGEMVEHTVKTVDPLVKFKLVTATRGKAQRMEPVVALYEQGKIHHVGKWPKLESEMTRWSRGAGWSPNRVDALVWAIYSIFPELGGRGRQGVEQGWIRM